MSGKIKPVTLCSRREDVDTKCALQILILEAQSIAEKCDVRNKSQTFIALSTIP